MKSKLKEIFEKQIDSLRLVKSMEMSSRQLARKLSGKRNKKPRKPAPKGRKDLIARQKKGRPRV